MSSYTRAPLSRVIIQTNGWRWWKAYFRYLFHVEISELFFSEQRATTWDYADKQEAKLNRNICRPVGALQLFLETSQPALVPFRQGAEGFDQGVLQLWIRAVGIPNLFGNVHQMIWSTSEIFLQRRKTPSLRLFIFLTCTVFYKSLG